MRTDRTILMLLPFEGVPSKDFHRSIVCLPKGDSEDVVLTEFLEEDRPRFFERLLRAVAYIGNDMSAIPKNELNENHKSACRSHLLSIRSLRRGGYYARLFREDVKTLEIEPISIQIKSAFKFAPHFSDNPINMHYQVATSHGNIFSFGINNSVCDAYAKHFEGNFARPTERLNVHIEALLTTLEVMKYEAFDDLDFCTSFFMFLHFAMLKDTKAITVIPSFARTNSLKDEDGDDKKAVDLFHQYAFDWVGVCPDGKQDVRWIDREAADALGLFKKD